MSTEHLVITMYSDWLVATSEGQGMADASPVTDGNGLPYIPGRSLRGLLREAVGLTANDARLQDAVFGRRPQPGDPSATVTEGAVCISDARLTRDVAEAVLDGEGGQELMTVRRQTAICPDTGGAQQGSLRSLEVAMPGLTLVAEVSGEAEALDAIRLAAPLVQHLGNGRSRGLGRCRMTLQQPAKEATP
jgi:CRISPR/Cas system CSM-associated protein Csm3 (group 7 of RAMP superfamily)